MILFHSLSQNDQHNVLHYCMHIVVEDMLDDGVEIEPHSDEDKRMKVALEQAIAEALKLPEEEQFEFVVNHQEVGQMIFDIALDMARSSFYASSGEMVIHYEDLRPQEPEENAEPQTDTASKEQDAIKEAMEEINNLSKKTTILN